MRGTQRLGRIQPQVIAADNTLPSIKSQYIQRSWYKSKNMSSYVLGFRDIDKTKLMVVGGKGANLGELARIEGIHVPDGFCVSTEAF